MSRGYNRRQETRAETDRRQAQVAGKLQGDAIGDSIAAMGFQADDVDRLLPAARAAALGNNAGLAAMMSEQQVGMSAADIAEQQARTDANNMLTQSRAQDMAYQSELQPGAVELQQQQIQNARLQQSVLENDILRASYALPNTVAAMNPLTSMPGNFAISGPEYDKQQTGVDRYLGMLERINEYQGLVSEYGSEAVGEIAVRMKQLENSIIFDAITAKGAGAPQAAEIEAISKGIPSATSVSANVRGAAQALLPGGVSGLMRQNQEDTINAGYQQLAAEISRAIMQAAEINPALRVNFGMLDPSVFDGRGAKPSDVRDYYQSTTGVNFLMQ